MMKVNISSCLSPCNSSSEIATWDSPPRSDEPGYLAFEAAFQRFIDSQNVFVRKSDKDIKKLDSRVKDGYAQHALRQKSQPKLGQNNQLQLMPFQVNYLAFLDPADALTNFQMDGFDWLCDNWWNLQPCILADEMGLVRLSANIIRLYSRELYTG
jgi:SNF2 family DNA or RNA helicase